MRKKTLVDRLFIERGFRHFSCGACTYWTDCIRRLRYHIECVHFQGPRIRCNICDKEHKNINSATAHWYRFHFKPPTREESLDQPPPPPPPTPHTTNRPIKEKWILNSSTSGSRTGNDRRNSSEEIMSRRQDSGSICKTSGTICQSCRHWFKSKWELHAHMQAVCPPVTRTLGLNNLH